MSEAFLFPRRPERDKTKKSSSPHVKYPLCLSDFNEISRQTFEKSSDINFHENLPLGAELFHADRDRVTETQP